MSRYAGLVQQPQRLPKSLSVSERAFFRRALDAKENRPSREAVVEKLNKEKRRAVQQERQWRKDERQWKKGFDAWWERRLEAINRGGANRRMAVHGIPVNTLTLEEWKLIKTRYHYRCAYCQQRRPLTKDHIVPISKGGHHTKINVIPACQPCNSKKRDRPAFLYKPKLVPF